VIFLDGSPALSSGMVVSMVMKKITVTVDEDQLARVRALVAGGRAPNVSAFVQHSIDLALDDVAGWGGALADALSSTGGPITDEERAWADQMLSGPGPKKRKPSAA